MTDTFNKSQGPSETPQEREFELRAHVGSVWSGGRLFIGMYTFLLASLVFSYFYLRSSNNGQLWRLPHQSAPSAFGWAIYLSMLLTAVLAVYGQRRLRKGGVSDFQVAGWTGVFLGVLAFILQIVQLTKLGFYPGSSGYASSFIGFAVLNIAGIVVGTYWLETTLARSLRMRRELGGEKPELSKAATAQSWRANVASMTYFWGFLALSGTLFVFMFYVS
jgi:heme/copper-type cytochrome/quinol oxidase subunit 3